MRTRLIVFTCVAMLALPGLASAQQLFDFYGQALLPASIGMDLSLYSVVDDPAPLDTPLPLDFANYEYTLVITGLTLNVDGSTQLYSGGIIALYEDASTPADYANPSTFIDGTPLLVGTVGLSRSVLIGSIGSVSGEVDWTGGSRIGDIAPPQRLNWAILSGTNSAANQVEPGYDETWDGKVEPPGPIVPGQEQSWGQIKELYRH